MSYLTYNNLSCWPVVTAPPEIIFEASTGTPITLVTGGMDIPVGTVIPPNSTTVPPNTVTVIKPFLNLRSFRGGISLNDGFFTVPADGQYLITIMATFMNPPLVSQIIDYRALYIYKVEYRSQPQGVVTLVAKATTISTLPFQVANTDLTLSYIANLKANDRIFMAARQVTRDGDNSTITISQNTRVAIRRII